MDARELAYKKLGKKALAAEDRSASDTILFKIEKVRAELKSIGK